MSSGTHLTDCGLPGIRRIPYGIHMCHFYRDRHDLAAALVPYFAAGLNNHERCIWITSEPLGAAAAEESLRAGGLDPRTLAGKGSLVVRDYSDWYTAGERDVVGLWLEEERQALAAGYDGLRITGNTSFLTAESWESFMDYEARLNRRLPGTRIVTLCSYALPRCGASDVLEVVRHHSCTLDRPDHGWQFLTPRSEETAATS